MLGRWLRRVAVAVNQRIVGPAMNVGWLDRDVVRLRVVAAADCRERLHQQDERREERGDRATQAGGA